MRGHARFRKYAMPWWLYAVLTLGVGALFVFGGISMGIALGIPRFLEVSDAFTHLTLITPQMLHEALRQAPAYMLAVIGAGLVMFGLVAGAIQCSDWMTALADWIWSRTE
ncbi:MAG TPA: hypothetical protein VD862_03925 [Candidatus Paceibacterota bacterium]|nr:hypothetical protein [Candidatus Paceibacterota bacterium]